MRRIPSYWRLLARVLMSAGWLNATGLCLGAETLRLFIWSEYLEPAAVTEFEQRFHCKVSIDLYEDAESMFGKLQAGGTALYDLVVPPDYLVPALVKSKMLLPLSTNAIANWKNLDGYFLNPPYDPGNRYTVPYQWGTVGLYVRAGSGKPPAATWGLVFDPKQQAGKFVLIDSMRDLLGAALKYQRHTLNSVAPADLKAARDLVIEAKQRSSGFEGGVAGRNKVLAKSAQVAIVYSGDGLRGTKQDTNTVYLIPREGSQIWVDNLAIPARAPNRALAVKFINYILEPEIGARISNYTRFASPNQAALKFIDPIDRANPAIYPPPEMRARLEFLQDLGSQTRLYDEIWTQIKSR